MAVTETIVLVKKVIVKNIACRQLNVEYRRIFLYRVEK